MADIGPGTSGSQPGWLTPAGDGLYFRADNGILGPELWWTDGSETHQIADIYPGNFSGRAPFALLAVPGGLYFVDSDDVSGYQIWATTGTKVAEMTNSEPSFTMDGITTYPVQMGGLLYFVGWRAEDGTNLWRLNGGSSELVASSAAPGLGPEQFAVAGSTLYFSASDASGRELWATRGVGGYLVKDINPTGHSNPRHLTDVDGTLFFMADDGVHGDELWKTDGSPAGTVLVRDIAPGPASSMSNGESAQLANVNGILFFEADDGVHGAELWKSDGTTAGTELVADISPGPASSMPQGLYNGDGTVYFGADDGVHGFQIWKSDGTAPGTVPVTDIPGGAWWGLYYYQSLGPIAWITDVDGVYYFMAAGQVWATDGRRTAPVTDPAAGTFFIDVAWNNLDGRQMAALDRTLYFAFVGGAYPSVDSELWAYTPGCGDGFVDRYEACDEGPANGTPGSCCDAACHPSQAGTTCRPSSGPCDVAEFCDGVGTTCPEDELVPDETSCGSTDPCAGIDRCVSGTCEFGTPIVCDDGDPCTHEECDPANGCVTQPVPGCVPGGSTESTVGGPLGLCTEGVVDPATHTCVLTTPTAELRIPLDGPPYALPTATRINLAALDTTVLCTATVAVGGNGPSMTHFASCTQLLPEGLPFAPGSGVIARFAWENESTACNVQWVALPEGELQLFDESLLPVTAACGASATDPECPTEPALVYPCTTDFCTDATCRPDANVWEARDVRHFSHHGVGLSCGRIEDKVMLKIGRAMEDSGRQSLTLKGVMRRTHASPIDPIRDGARVTIYDKTRTVFDQIVPSGAYDKATGRGWKINAARTKWVYKSFGGGSITSVKLLDRSAKLGAGTFALVVKAKTVAAPLDAPYVEPQVYLPGTGECFGRTFDPAQCVLKGTSVVCK